MPASAEFTLEIGRSLLGCKIWQIGQRLSWHPSPNQIKSNQIKSNQKYISD
jgi:hypothetical protein